MADESRESLEDVRSEKLKTIAALGHDPWGQRFDGHQAIGGDRRQADAEQWFADEGSAGLSDLESSHYNTVLG